MKNRVKVVIGGESYTIVSEDEESYILQTAAGVDERMHAFLEASPVSALQAAVLTAMKTPNAVMDGAIRISLCPENTEEEMRFTAEKIKEHVELLRRFARR